jgi:hypothetical protein
MEGAMRQLGFLSFAAIVLVLVGVDYFSEGQRMLGILWGGFGVFIGLAAVGLLVTRIQQVREFLRRR